jgi:hypothetical protein
MYMKMIPAAKDKEKPAGMRRAFADQERRETVTIDAGEPRRPGCPATSATRASPRPCGADE